MFFSATGRREVFFASKSLFYASAGPFSLTLTYLHNFQQQRFVNCLFPRFPPKTKICQKKNFRKVLVFEPEARFLLH
jgi:hypothetical protein